METIPNFAISPSGLMVNIDTVGVAYSAIMSESARIKELEDLLEDLILLDTHAPFCRFPTEDCSPQCMNQSYYNVKNLANKARVLLGK